MFESLYAEALDRIGDFTDSPSQEGAMTFESCQFKFRHDDTKSVPATILGGSNRSELIFRACRFEGTPSVYSVLHPNTRFEDCRVSVNDRTVGTVPRYQAFAHNALSGGMAVDPRFLQPQGLAFLVYNLDTGTSTVGQLPKEALFRDSTREFCVPAAVWQYLHFSETYGVPIRKRFNYYERRKDVHFSAVTLNDLTLTLTFSSLSENNAMRFGVMPGDVIRDLDTGMIFFIRSRTGTTITAEGQNNYVSDGAGGFNTREAFSTTSGRLQFINSRIYTPSYTTVMDFTSGSDTATSIGRADGFSSYLDTDIVPGDYYFADSDTETVFTGGNAEVESIDTTARTMTFVGNASTTVSRKTVGQWIRTPPPNE